MQVLPAFISALIRKEKMKREFLLEYFKETAGSAFHGFLKRILWRHFDVNKVFGVSSVIDLLVYQETVIKGRKSAFLDYRINREN